MKVDTAKHQRFAFHNLQQLKAEAHRLGLRIPIAENGFSVLSDPVAVGPKKAPNRFVVQPMEGFDADELGTPGPLSFRRYERYARGGSGIIWFEATAVQPEARSNPAQAYIHAGNAAQFKRLVDNTRNAAREVWGHELVLILQLTHSGRYSKPAGVPEPITAHHSEVLDPLHNLPPDYSLVSDTYLDDLQEIFVRAAGLAAQAGFDGVDVKSCHRYLVSELLASFTRKGRYGGTLENRSRMLMETLQKIKAAVPDIFVTTRMNAYDGIRYPYGFGVDREDASRPDLEEPLEVVRRLVELGVPLLNISIGNPYFNPHLGRPYDWPIQGFAAPDEHPLFGIDRFLAVTRTLQESFPDLPIVGGGYSWLRQFLPHVASAVISSGGATLIGQGRSAFAYPDAPADILSRGAMNPARCCITCSGCTQIMRDGGKTGCVVKDSATYGAEYRLGRRFALDRLKEEALRCRGCEQATCVLGCPAGVDVPGFIKAFADGDIAEAYRILRRSNALPETCAYVCPSDVQCEGGCLESIFCENPIAIRDIQRIVSRIARLQGLAGVKIPESGTGKRVTIVGGGPTGIACAAALLELGHSVDIYDARAHLGGTPEGFIPEGRLSAEEARAEIQAVLAPALEAGRAAVRTGVALGRSKSMEDIASGSDAVFLAFGLSESLALASNGHEQVVDALSFLDRAKSGRQASVPDKIAVLGGGNTAMDAGTTAIKLGARDVYVIYRRSFAEMPAWKPERDAFLELGGHLVTLTQPLAYQTGPDGGLVGIRVARTELAGTDESGRRKPHVIPNSESVIPVSFVIEAIGQRIEQGLLAELAGYGVQSARQGLIVVDPETFMTTREGVFCGGDAVNGGMTAVQGISEGSQAAVSIHRFLMAQADRSARTARSTRPRD